ncbi:hypothetical protein CPB84DRAFT_1790091 [Gymnopilus junonius]|uniref:Uncharacterized protein n=1 Tax=Gymnopilus junonius TaxID=109634 RepID=A0A9P5ND78_GYMJU|nr:hypothetical protein CPB84DRAFT_1790091 [Gymnopilus junonius]
MGRPRNPYGTKRGAEPMARVLELLGFPHQSSSATQVRNILRALGRQYLDAEELPSRQDEAIVKIIEELPIRLAPILVKAEKEFIKEEIFMYAVRAVCRYNHVSRHLKKKAQMKKKRYRGRAGQHVRHKEVVIVDSNSDELDEVEIIAIPRSFQWFEYN